MNNFTIFEEDQRQLDEQQKRLKEDASVNSSEKSGFSWALFSVIALVSIIVAAIVLALWYLLFAPSPTRNVSEAAEIIYTDIQETLGDARAYTIETSYDQSVSTLIVETHDNKCHSFRLGNNGAYQAFEAEHAISESLLRFEDINYYNAYRADKGHPAFEYYHSADNPSHGIYLNMVIGGEFVADPRNIDISSQVETPRTEEERFDNSVCWN